MPRKRKTGRLFDKPKPPSCGGLMEAANKYEAERLVPRVSDADLQRAYHEALKIDPRGPKKWKRYVLIHRICLPEIERRMNAAERNARHDRDAEELIACIEGRPPRPQIIRGPR